MESRYATDQEISNWNNLIISNPDGGNIFQSKELLDIKSKSRWNAQYVVIDGVYISVLEKKIPLLGNLWYVPKGPGITSSDELKKILPSLITFAKKQKVFIVRIEPEIPRNQLSQAQQKELGIIPGHPIQPNSSTVIIDISKSLDEIMAIFPQQSRYAIKRAQRDGIETKMVESNEENFKIMVDLMHQSMADKPVVIRDDIYYKNFWKTYSDSGSGKLFFAYCDKIPVAGAFVLILGQKATYKDGGSVRKKSIYGTSHALQWHIIEWLHKLGVKSYDLCGAPPAAEINNKTHPFYGIGLFKTSFNKTVAEYVGLFDVIISPLSYKIWKLVGERVMHRYYSMFLKEMFY